MTLKKTELSFGEGFVTSRGRLGGDKYKVFDWDKAAEIIKEAVKKDPKVVAEAGLQRDWEHTAGIIFEEGEPVLYSYTYLRSNWAVPTLILTDTSGKETEIECYTTDPETRFSSNSKWDEISLKILKK